MDRRWVKVARDLWLHKARTLMVVLAIAAGTAGFATVLNTWALVKRVTREQFLAANPVSAVLHVDSVTPALLGAARAVPGVRLAEARRTVRASIRTAGGWRTALLFIADDHASARIGALRPHAGAWPPREGQLIIEKSSLDFSGLAVGDTVLVSPGPGTESSLHLAGVVRDVTVAPGWMEHIVYGFGTTATLARLGLAPALDELRLSVDPALSREDARRIAWSVRDRAQVLGYRVGDVEVPEPGEHIHAAQMDSLLLTQGAFGLLAMLLSGLLVINLTTAMLAGQVREIGIMKTLGATPAQLARMYLLMALALGLVAALLALPPAAFAGRRYAGLKAELLNFDLAGTALPVPLLLGEVLVCLLVPVLAAALPVRRGSRVSVAEALRDLGIVAAARPPRLLLRTAGVTRPLLLSLRNAFRKRQRMTLTLAALAAGGAVYIGALNLRAAIRGAVGLAFDPMRFDVVLRLSRPAPPESLEAIVRAVPGVAGVEAWAGARATAVRGDGTRGDAFTVAGPPERSPLLGYLAREGRWLAPGDGRALVVSRSLQRADTALGVGRTVALDIDGRTGQWTVVGAVDAGPAPAAWAPRATLLAWRNGLAGTIVVAAGGTGSPLPLIGEVRGALAGAGHAVQSSTLLEEGRRATEDHLLMVADFLGVMAWIIMAVGALGLASTMSMAVLERTREIGVLRAVGARHGAIIGIVLAEGLVIALLSGLVAVPLSVPMSLVLGEAFGRVMLPVPARWLPELGAVLLWFAVLVGGASLACAWPAIRATRITARAALSYE